VSPPRRAEALEKTLSGKKLYARQPLTSAVIGELMNLLTALFEE
jgi:hypothetical protein